MILTLSALDVQTYTNLWSSKVPTDQFKTLTSGGKNIMSGKLSTKTTLSHARVIHFQPHLARYTNFAMQTMISQAQPFSLHAILIAKPDKVLAKRI